MSTERPGDDVPAPDPSAAGEFPPAEDPVPETQIPEYKPLTPVRYIGNWLLEKLS